MYIKAVRSLFALVFFAALAPFSLSAQISGTIMDSSSPPQPIEGARVAVQASNQFVLTAADGTFNIAGASGSSLVIVGAKRGYFNSSAIASAPAAGVMIQLELVPITDDPTYEMQQAFTCSACHNQQFLEWTDSPMAKAGRNTWVYDIYDGSGTPGGMGGFVYTRDSVFASHNPNSECSSCHQPIPWLNEPFSALEPLDALSQGAMDGISCDVCHKIADVDVTKINFPGLYPGAVVTNRPAGPDFDPIIYGMLGDSTYTSDIMRASYNPQLAAEVCGVCHQDANDHDEDQDFSDPGSIISEPTYLEWLNSDYANENLATYASCVDCHMPSGNSDQACNVLSPPLIRDPSTIRSHNILGTTPQYLENAVTMTMNVNQTGAQIDVEVSIENTGTGHHVPTGVTVRNCILVIDAWREQDGEKLVSTGTQVIHDLGGIGNPEQGYYAGLPGKFFAKVNHDASGAGPTFFTDATGIQFDSRIPALQTDTTNYQFEVPAGGGELHVKARMIYRRAFRFLVDAKQWTTDGHGNPLADIAAPHYGHLMEISEEVISLPYTAPNFMRGDADGDGILGFADVFKVISYLFSGGDALDCPDAGDFDDDGSLTLGDVVSELTYLFAGGSAPAAPGTTCGADPTADTLGACSSPCP